MPAVGPEVDDVVTAWGFSRTVLTVVLKLSVLRVTVTLTILAATVGQALGLQEGLQVTEYEML